MIRSLPAVGLSADELFAATGLSPAELDTDDERIALEVVQRASAWMTATVGPGSGLRLAEAMAPQSTFVLGYLTANSATLREAYGQWARYRRVALDGAPMTLTENDEVASLAFDFPAPLARRFPSLVEGYVGFALARGRELAGKRWVPSRVLLQGPETDPETYDQVFGCPVDNESDRSLILFPVGILDLPVAGADPNLKRYLLPFAEEALAALPAEADDVLQVRRIVLDMLEQGQPSLEKVAGALHVSSRTLQRRLDRAGTSFAEVLDDVRRSAAVSYLRDRRIAISETAFLLGFSEPSTFYRAFKRWTGSTPADYRRSVMA